MCFRNLKIWKSFSFAILEFWTDSSMNGALIRMKKFLGMKVIEPEFREFLSPSATVQFCSNTVTTAQYNLVSFFPVNLLVQFMKPANVYFLVIAVMQLIPAISLTGTMPTVAIPLVIVVLVNMAKDGVEDYRRHVSDRRENSQLVRMLDRTTGCLTNKKWKKVRVGDIIAVENRQSCPADIVLLASSDGCGVCFIETANLDGETNLKLKSVPKEFSDQHPLNGNSSLEEAVKSLSEQLPVLRVKCQLPNKSLYEFDGQLTLGSSDVEAGTGTVALSANNVVLRACKLRNTEWIVGLVVYSGRETKIQMNSAAVRKRKVSALEKLTGEFTLIAFWIQVILCVVGALVWGLIASSATFEQKLYLNISTLTRAEIFGKACLKFFSFLILFSNFIPISLTVTMGIVKVFQSAVMERSAERIFVRSSDLNEELGQVDFLFTDKTGTLTKNLMEFRKCSIEGHSFGTGLTEIRRSVLRKQGREVPEDLKPELGSRATPQVNFVDPQLDKKMSHEQDANQSVAEFALNSANMFFFVLAVNHTVVVEGEGRPPTTSPRYSGSSPDESALTYGASHFGFTFLSRTSSGVAVSLPAGKKIFVEILASFEFDSTRKRSSVLARVGHRNLVLAKGADSVMLSRLAIPADPTSLEHMEQYANDGLRILCVAAKEVGDEWVGGWMDRFRKANMQPAELAVLAEELESGLMLTGVSAIEDKLQANVSETIEALRQAGVRVWMLTGDKLETAVNIGLATSLIATVGMYTVTIDRDTVGGGDFLSFLTKTKLEFQAILAHDSDNIPSTGKGASEVALVIDGVGLECILSTPLFRVAFAELASLCTSVVCCRVSPEQKGAVVRLVRKHGKKITLAVGDGANDCNMIQAANIGVGLRGQEGMQAFNSSDYGIDQFQTLKPLLLVHGRWAYRRIGKLVLYMFYKNVVICLPSYFLNIMAALFSGQRLFEEYMYQLFNVLFTALPIILFGIFEQDLTKTDCLQFPQLYRAGKQRVHASKRSFGQWMLTGLWHSVALFYIPYYSMSSLTDSDGIPADLYLFGSTVYLGIIVTVNLKLFLESHYRNALFVLSLLFSTALWFASLKILEVLPVLFSLGGETPEGVSFAPPLAGLSKRLYQSPMTFFLVFASVVVALSRDFLFKAYRLKYWPRDYHVVMSSRVQEPVKEKPETQFSN